MNLDILTPLQQGLAARASINKNKDTDEQRKINAMKLMGVEDSQRRGAMTEDAKTAALLLLNGDNTGTMEFLSERAQESSMSGNNPRETMELYEAVRSGDIPLALGMIDNYLSIFDDNYAPKANPKKESLQYKEGGIIFNPNNGEVKIDEMAANRLAEIAQKKELGIKLSIKDKQSINKDITGFLKDTTLIHDTSKALKGLQKIPSGPAALAVVFKFMKALDPTSVVREGEQASAEQSAGVPAAVRNFYNKLASGEKLGVEQIQQFVDTAQGLSNSAIDSSSTQITSYLNTYGDDLPAKFSKSIMGRVPKAFEVKINPKNIIQYDKNGNPI